MTKPQSEAVIVTTALARASDHLGLSNRVVAAVVGLSEPTISRLRCGNYVLKRNEKEFELSLLLVRMYRSLTAIVGGDDTVAAAWLGNHNTALRGKPVQCIQTIHGLLRIVDYLDARRASV